MSPALIDSSWRHSKNRRWGCGGARAKNTDRKGRHPAFQSSDQPGLPTCATKAEIALSLFAGGRNPGPLGTWGILRARNLTWAAKMGFRGLFQKPWQSFQLTGEPHYGSHAWPSIASAIITFVEDSRVDNILSLLHQLDVESPKLGLRAFVMNVEKTI